MEENRYNKDQLIQITINVLSGINVPAVMTEQIGMPLYGSIQNLITVQQLIAAEEEDRRKRKEAQEKETAEAEAEAPKDETRNGENVKHYEEAVEEEAEADGPAADTE